MNSTKVIKRIFEEFKDLTGREYDFVYKYKMDDAEVAIFALGTTVESAQVAADIMRERGIKAGVVSLRVFRPFPFREVQEALSNVKAVAAMDRSAPGGAFGTLFNEISASMLPANNKPIILNYIYGLGGRDTTIEQLVDIYKQLDECAKAKEYKYPLQQFIGLRGPKLSFF
jgi:pyruvate ferredoxin oxidoreductase alpha subunit